MFRLALTIIHADEFPFSAGRSYSQVAAGDGGCGPRFLARAGSPLGENALNTGAELRHRGASAAKRLSFACLTTPSAISFESRPSAKATGPRSAAWSTARRRASR